MPPADNQQPVTELAGAVLEIWKRSATLTADMYKRLGDLTDQSFRDRLVQVGLQIIRYVTDTLDCLDRSLSSRSAKFLSRANESCNILGSAITAGVHEGHIEAETGRQWLD